jgi:peptidyl-prolyl cis-trans isomerase SurA
MNLKSLICSFLVSLCLYASSAFAEPKLIDRIVAVVDNKPVLYSEISKKISQGPLIKVSDYPADPKASDFEKALNDAVNFRLVLNKAKELDIEVENEQVEKQINDMLKENDKTREWLVSFLQSQGKNFDEYKNDIREQMLFVRFRGRVIVPQVKITEKDIESYYLKKVGSATGAMELSMRSIVIPLPSHKPEDPVFKQKEALAQELYAKLKGGLSFTEAEKIYSAGGGSEAKIYKLTDLSSEIRQEVEKLQIGGFTNPIKTSVGFYFFYLESKKFTGSQEYLEKKKQLEGELRNYEINNQTNQWLKNARGKAKITLIKE